MRKFQSLILAAVLLGSGLVAGSAGTASAAPYPGSVDTNCQGKALNNPREGNPARVRFRVTTGGSGAANGSVVFQYIRRSNDTVVREFSRRYFGPGYTKYSFDNVPQGRYRVKTFFNSRPGNSVYQNCNDGFRQTVR